jgi:uncharacterized membrane protein YgcG
MTLTARCALLFAVLCCALPWPARADERILEYRSDIRVQESGVILVTETLRVRAEGREIRRGIYRDFPTRYRDRWGNRVTVGFRPAAVRRNGSDEPWHSEDLSNGVRVYFGSAQRLLKPGVHEYEFVYETDRQLGFFEDHDELYFNAIGTGWRFPIDRGVVTVTLPFEAAPGEVMTDVYTGSFGAREADAHVSAPAENQVRIETTAPLRPGQGLTVAVAWPKGRVPAPGPARRIDWSLTDNAAAVVLLAGLLAVLALYLWAWNRVGRDPRKGVIIPRFEPPEGLSPAACRYVRDMSFHRDAFTAAIISLAVKGQLRIEEEDKDFSLVREPAAPAAALTPGERAVLDKLLPGPAGRIAMDNKNHRRFQSARSALHQALKREYLGRLFRLNGIYLAPPVLLSLAAAAGAYFLDGGPAVWITYAVLTLALHAIFLYLLRAPTTAGRQVMDQIEGFGRYLGTAEQDRLDRMRSPQLTPEVFEAFLPYAYALGVENQWCQRLAREMPQEERQRGAYNPGWYHGRFRGANALHHLGSGFSRSFSSAIASASSPPGSSSGSGGGGSSGGGGGGGGGGGW